VRLHAFRVVDADVDALRAAGWSDEQIFELTVATALSVGLERLR
jgi:alkylhydroperoxidase family enzyme